MKQYFQMFEEAETELGISVILWSCYKLLMLFWNIYMYFELVILSDHSLPSVPSY